MSEETFPIYYQKLDMKVSSLENKILGFQSSIDTFQTDLRHITHEENRSAVRLKYFITSVITLGVGVFALAGYLNYSVNTSQINDKLNFEVNKVEDKLKEISNQSEVNSSSLETPYKRSGYVLGVPYISRAKTDEGLYTYTLRIEFQLRVNVTGQGLTAIIGLLRKYDGDYVKLMASPSNSVYNDELSNGMLGYFTPAPVVEGFPSEVSWSESITKTSCKDVEDLLNSVKSDKNLGAVYIKPIFSKMKNKQDFSVFKLDIGELASLYVCKDYR